MSDGEGRVFVREMISETYGLDEFRRRQLAAAQVGSVGEGRADPPAPPEQQHGACIEGGRAADSDQDQARFAERVEEGAGQASTAEVADDLALHAEV